MNNKPILALMVGIPGSGKTAFAKKFCKYFHYTYISRDDIRFSKIEDKDDYFDKESLVFTEFIDSAVLSLRKNTNVLLDATHLSKQSRKKVLKNINYFLTNYRVIYFVMDTPLKVCSQRNAKRKGRSKVPNSVILSMANTFCMPLFNEDNRIQAIYTVLDKPYGYHIQKNLKGANEPTFIEWKSSERTF